jgi:polysaccharide pyruvyl transferase WcaK-like protein
MPTLRVDPAGSAAHVPRFPQAADMAGFISTLHLLVAHRLHACVTAYSYGVPHIGLTWDRKMQSFFETVDRARFVCGAVSTSPAGVLSLADEAIRLGINAEDRRSVLARTHSDIALLIRSLMERPA